MRSKIIVPIIFGCLLLWTNNAKADCYCGPSIAKQTTAIGEMFTTQTAQLTNAFGNISQTLTAQTASQEAMNDKLYKNLEALVIRTEESRKVQDSQRRISAQGFNPCSGRDVSSAAASGSKAAGQTREESNKEAAKSGEGTQRNEAEAANSIRKTVQEGPLKTEVPMGHDFFPENGLIDSANTRKVEDEIRLITDPYPNPKVEDEDSLSGVQAKVEQRIKQSRLGIASDTLRAVKTDSDAGTPADLLEEYVKTANASHVSVPKDASGMTSMSVYYRILGKDTRIFNPNWHQYMIDGVTDELAVLRELVQIQALQLAIAVDNREWLKRISALLAEQVAIQAQDASNTRIKSTMFAPGETPIAAPQGSK